MSIFRLVSSIFLIIVFIPNTAVADNIQFKGVKYEIALDNQLALKKTDKPTFWQNENDFIKLSYSEHNKPKQALKKQIREKVDASINLIETTELNELTIPLDFLTVKAFVAESSFLHIFAFTGNENSSAVVELSLPSKLSTLQRSNLVNMLKSMNWKENQRIILSENSTIEFALPDGFIAKSKYANSLVLETTPDNTQLRNAKLVLSILPQNRPFDDLREKTADILESSSSILNFRIDKTFSFAEGVDNAVMAKAIGSFGNATEELDINHITLRLDSNLLIIQLITAKDTENSDNLSNILISTLSNIHY